ncbi:hypothetical protein [Thermoactinomyces sp. DSM 45892]|uniref:hypothetical protein n=1 Tax=Thermoactinomyces sp. DSM 45892 TaxID=1882753 RepID=UPI00089812F6|nr:hypothetical protein [Thermoactinomyces sp. DSM 45892]SDX97299.1 hypothetical protein SAMN05444416_101139 [Thermoactinomyces sp. DSM 45892]
MSQIEEEKVLDAFSKGVGILVIQEELSCLESDISRILIKYKEKNRQKNSFSDDFKKLIAERDMHNVPRKTIATELRINVATVSKACKQFGQKTKGRVSSYNLYSEIVGINNLKRCPNCNSEKVNRIESLVRNFNTSGIFCMDCGNEYFELKGKFYHINFEYID